MNTGNEYSYVPAETGRYVIILPPGKYNIFVEASGYEPISKDMQLLDKSSFKAEIIKDFVLMPIGTVEKQ